MPHERIKVGHVHTALEAIATAAAAREALYRQAAAAATEASKAPPVNRPAEDGQAPGE